jgi:hypothetical protein
MQDRCRRGWVIVLHKITSTTGVGVSVAKAQHLWMIVVGPWMSTLLPNRVIFRLHRRIEIQTRTGFHQVVSRARLIDERFLVLPQFFPTVQKSHKNSGLVCASQNPLSLLLVLLSYDLLSFWLHWFCRIAGLRFSVLEFRILITFYSQLLAFIWIPCSSNLSTHCACIWV